MPSTVQDSYFAERLESARGLGWSTPAQPVAAPTRVAPLRHFFHWLQPLLRFWLAGRLRRA